MGNSNNPDVPTAARAEIDRCFPDDPPPILDPFDEGPFRKAMIEIPHRFAGMPPVHPDVDMTLTTPSPTPKPTMTKRSVGLLTDKAIPLASSGLLIHADRIPESEEPPEPGLGQPPVDTDGPDGPTTPPVHPAEPESSQPTQFYTRFTLDPVRCIRQLGEIADNISSKLGDGVELVLEARAKSEEGFDESTRRTVSENARSLGAHYSEFK